MDETLNTIKKRYIHERAIYTWCGIALVAVNPYQEQDIYGQQAVETYHSASHSVYLQLDPHIYAVTEDAYSKLERHLRNQSIIVSGESGAGKTVSAKHAMRYLASIASSKSKIRIEDRVLASNPIMEAIGNATTVRNDNSSRFGKYIQIYFDRYGRKILGANMRTYLLEKSRVTNLQNGERNYHLFYQLLSYAHKNPAKMTQYKLLDEDDNNAMRTFRYLGGIEPQEPRDDLRKFNEALKTLNVDQQRIDIIFRIVAGILHGGNIEFKRLIADDTSLDGSGGDDMDASCTIDENSFHFKACCELIGLEPNEFKERLTIRLLRSGRETIAQPLNKQKAEYGRDAMMKCIYECLFNWLVALINLSLKHNSQAAINEIVQNVVAQSPASKKSAINQEPQFIGVLDIYGFENFSTNSFEQFCINYANEVLQQQYNQHVFKLEQEEYIREGIDWTFIEYSDNQPVIDIIESRPIGVLNLLDEECRMPKGSDESWCAKLYEHLAPSPSKKRAKESASLPPGVFRRPRLNYQNSFVIAHYAEEVNYNVETFLEKNRDKIAEEQSELLARSEVLAYIIDDPLLSQTTSKLTSAKNGRSSTVAHQFRASLAALIKILNDTEPHYIRCIKPNDKKKAFDFNEERAIQQLKACGVYETIRISNNGFPSRCSYKEFARRYCIAIYGLPIFEHLARISLKPSPETTGEATEQQRTENGTDDAQEHAANLSRFLSHFGSSDVKPICAAICKVAYEDSIYDHLRTKEEQSYINTLFERHGKRPNAIYQFGKSKIFFRAGQMGYLERIRGQRLREYTVTIQRHVRGWLARVSFAKRREQIMEEMRREASLVSLQNQVASLQTELETVKEEKKDQLDVNVSRMGSMYQFIIDMMHSSIQPHIVASVLEFEALGESLESFDSLDSQQSKPNYLVLELNKFHDLIRKNFVPEDIAVQAFKQLFYLICAQSLNQLLIRRDLCHFFKAMQISYNLSSLVQWCRERYLVHWKEIVEQLDPITQAIKLLQTRKSSEDIETIEEVCNKLRPSQIIKLLNMYTSSYEEQITTDFIHELEEYLHKTREARPVELDDAVETDSNNNDSNFGSNNDLLMDTKFMFEFIDTEDAAASELMATTVTN